MTGPTETEEKQIQTVYALPQEPGKLAEIIERIDHFWHAVYGELNAPQNLYDIHRVARATAILNPSEIINQVHGDLVSILVEGKLPDKISFNYAQDKPPMSAIMGIGQTLKIASFFTGLGYKGGIRAVMDKQEDLAEIHMRFRDPEKSLMLIAYSQAHANSTLSIQTICVVQGLKEVPVEKFYDI